MKQKSLFFRLFGAALAFALIGAACGGGTDAASEDPTEQDSPAGEEDTDTEGSTDAAASEGVDTAAAGLTQVLTQGLDEHEYLAGTAVAMGVMKGLDSPEFSAAAEALDANSVDLSKAIASIYGEAGGKQFLKLWRAHIGFFVEYTEGVATGNTKLADAAKKKLDGYRSDFGAFIEAATEGELPKSAVEDALDPHVESTLTAIDTVVGNKKGNPFLALKEAATHLPGIATALAGAISTQNGLDGTADSPASQLQQTLTQLLDEHEYLAGITVAMGVQNGLDSPEFGLAAEALDANSVDLSKAVASVYGDEGGAQFLKLWRAHIGFFVDYTAAQAGGDAKGAKKALKDLDGYRADFGAFIEAATEGGLPKDAVEDALDPHIKSTITAIDTVLGIEEGNPFLALKEAATHLPAIATALSGAIVTQFPDKF